MFRRDPAHVVDQVVEPPRPLEQRLDDQQGPAVADERKSIGQG